jgi:YesN/AraC family two-component response regulator
MIYIVYYEAICYNQVAERLIAMDENKTPAQYYNIIYSEREKMFQQFPFLLEDKLTQAVMNADEKAAVEALKIINRAGNKAILASNTLRSVKNSVICSCALLTRAAIQAGVSPDESYKLSDAIIQNIEDFETINEVLNYEEEILILFISLIKRKVHDSVSLPVRRAIRYIDAHLNQKLKLATIAEHVGVNKKYLSNLFNKEMKISISDYISTRKIQESANFMRYCDHAISEIANLYGFSDQSYYTNVFKKIMGTTPAKYRSQARIK